MLLLLAGAAYPFWTLTGPLDVLGQGAREAAFLLIPAAAYQRVCAAPSVTDLVTVLRTPMCRMRIERGLIYQPACVLCSPL